jgi:hypothetical protein
MNLAGAQESPLLRKASVALGNELGRVGWGQLMQTLVALLTSTVTAKYRRFIGGLNHSPLFFIILEAGKSKIKVLANSVLRKGPLVGLQGFIFSVCAHVAFPRAMKREIH